ncbi:MAG: methionine aminotransferase [Bacteroidota bacterium]|nr:methionine aminotransferase [Bacteroidota bacterium]
MLSKLPAVGTTIFTTMSSLALRHKAINLGQGFPDYNMNEELIDLVTKAMKDGYNQYIHMNGYLPLREAIAEKCFNLYNADINPEEEITITPGGTYALYTAITTVLQPGDEVVVFEPAYDCYIPQVELNGAKAVTVELKFPDYHIDWDEVRSKINDRTRMIIINSPHNPTGSVLSDNDMQQLSEIVRDTNIIIVSDEVYEHLIFDDLEHESVLKYPELKDRSFIIFSFGKTYNCTGWKLGYCISSAFLMNEFRKIHQFNCFTSDTPKQIALADFIKEKGHFLQLGKKLQQKRDLFQDLMQQTKFKPLQTHGSYFQIYSYADISSENEKEFAIKLTKESGVATIPVSAFYRAEINNKVLRFCFSKKDETLHTAVDRLKKI